jgi:DNA invertase Pin-like site-specific DNA recombinase
MRAAIYARVSTSDQDCGLQLRELRAYCERRGWVVMDEYVDTGWSGAKRSRPALDRLMQHASEHRFEAVVTWKLDRLGRSVLHLVETIKQLQTWKVAYLSTVMTRW